MLLILVTANISCLVKGAYIILLHLVLIALKPTTSGAKNLWHLVRKILGDPGSPQKIDKMTWGSPSRCFSLGFLRPCFLSLVLLFLREAQVPLVKVEAEIYVKTLLLLLWLIISDQCTGFDTY